MTRLLRAARLAIAAAALVAGAGGRGAARRHSYVWRAGPSTGFCVAALRQPRCAEGRDHRFRRARRLRLPQPLHLEGAGAGGDPDPRLRDADGAELGRALRALRTARRIDRHRAESRVGGVHPAAGGAVLGREPGHRRGRDLVDGDAGGEGAAKIPECLGKGGERRADRRALGALHLRRARQRAAADHRAAADPEEGGLGGASTSPRAACGCRSGSGPYTIGAFEPGRFISFERDPDYWGRGPADQPRREQLRHASATSTSSTRACSSRRSPRATLSVYRELEPDALGGASTASRR